MRSNGPMALGCRIQVDAKLSLGRGRDAIEQSVMPSGPFKRRLYRNFPEDLRPSRLTHIMAHFWYGPRVYVSPVVALRRRRERDLSGAHYDGLVPRLYHLPLSSCRSAGVEFRHGLWRCILVPRRHASHSAPLAHPHGVYSSHCMRRRGAAHRASRPAPDCFLLAMRYYAGNWPYSVWLCKDGVLDRISQAFSTAGGHPKKQLARLYGPRGRREFNATCQRIQVGPSAGTCLT